MDTDLYTFLSRVSVIKVITILPSHSWVAVSGIWAISSVSLCEGSVVQVLILSPFELQVAGVVTFHSPQTCTWASLLELLTLEELPSEDDETIFSLDDETIFSLDDETIFSLDDETIFSLDDETIFSLDDEAIFSLDDEAIFSLDDETIFSLDDELLGVELDDDISAELELCLTI